MEPENRAWEKAMKSRGVGYISVRKAYSAATNHPVNVQVLSGKRTAAVRKMYSQIRQADKNKAYKFVLQACLHLYVNPQLSRKTMRGIVTIDARVVMKIILEASLSLPPYSRLSIVAVMAVGMPERTTRTPSIVLSVMNR